MSKTRIEWCDHTINPIVGCSKCSPGCDNCYAEKMAWRLSKNPLTAQKYAGIVDKNGWTGKIHYSTTNAHRHDEPHRVPGKNKRVFIGSMTDMFHPNVAQDALDEVFASILADTIFTNGHGHKFIMVTKRVDRMLEYFAPGPDVLLRRWCAAGDGWIFTDDPDISFSDYAEGQTIPQPEHEKHPLLRHEYLWPLPNFWALATICNQSEADEKIPLLLQVPATKRGVSVEPMLGAVNISHYLELANCQYDVTGDIQHYDMLLNWVISGLETGPNARPAHPDWLRSLARQCADAGVPYLHKSNGEWREADSFERGKYCSIIDCYRSARPEQRPEGSDAAFIKQFCQVALAEGSPAARLMRRVGKSKTGRLIDGVEYNQFPE
ncbi:phage Gp37/Gp68 family protein [Desulfovibrio sp. OttesenSCG-928-A18]|nr:phage Gp37/Gp68 family protein [Desulfovibrio sp. OttesenSCG-928-A18]